jgi:hypothetical protein
MCPYKRQLNGLKMRGIYIWEKQNTKAKKKKKRYPSGDKCNIASVIKIALHFSSLQQN